MSRRAKRGFLVSFVVVLLGAAIGYSTFERRSQAQAPQALLDVGKFRVGSDLGEERAGFSGRTKLQIFASASSADWASISSCLESEAVAAQMDFFTGILIDETAEPLVEATAGVRDGMRVVVRGLNGAYLGGLPAGFTCQELVALLQQVRATAFSGPEPSPIYANLLESTAAIEDLISKGERAKAAKFVTLLKEFEGATSPAVKAAEAKIGN
jgi:hypothetical protein